MTKEENSPWSGKSPKYSQSQKCLNHNTHQVIRRGLHKETGILANQLTSGD